MSFELNKGELLSWQVLQRQIDMFVKKTNFDVVVLATFPSKFSTRRNHLIHGTNQLRAALETHVTTVLESSAAQSSDGAPDSTLLDIRDLPDGRLSKMRFQGLRKLIPLLVTHSLPSNRHQPGWGNADRRPVWWPSDVPFVNPSHPPKLAAGQSWTTMLRHVAGCCYRHHGVTHLTGDDEDSLSALFVPPADSTVNSEAHSSSNHTTENTGNCNSLPVHPQSTSSLLDVSAAADIDIDDLMRNIGNGTYTLESNESQSLQTTINTDTLICQEDRSNTALMINETSLSTINNEDLATLNIQSTPNTSEVAPGLLSVSSLQPEDDIENQPPVKRKRCLKTTSKLQKNESRRSQRPKKKNTRFADFH